MPYVLHCYSGVFQPYLMQPASWLIPSEMSSLPPLPLFPLFTNVRCINLSEWFCSCL